jgi:hypothetical protein
MLGEWCRGGWMLAVNVAALLEDVRGMLQMLGKNLMVSVKRFAAVLVT